MRARERRRQVLLQAAIVANLVGVMALTVAVGGATRREQPRPAQTVTWRSATDAERRQYEAERLREALDELARSRQQTD